MVINCDTVVIFKGFGLAVGRVLLNTGWLLELFIKSDEPETATKPPIGSDGLVRTAPWLLSFTVEDEFKERPVCDDKGILEETEGCIAGCPKTDTPEAGPNVKPGGFFTASNGLVTAGSFALKLKVGVEIEADELAAI